MPFMWTRHLAEVLTKQSDVVQRVNLRPDYLLVQYRTGLRSRFWYGVGKPQPSWIALTAQDAGVGPPLPIVRQFETDLLRKSEFDHLLLMSRRQLSRCSLIGRYLAVHRFIQRQITVGHTGLQHPKILQRDIDFLRKRAQELKATAELAPELRFLNMCTRYAKRILAHFIDYTGIKTYSADGQKMLAVPEALTRPVPLFRNIRRLLRQNIAFSTSNLAVCLPPRLTQPAACNPLRYCLFLKSFNITGPILDLQPEFGTKAIAAALLGLEYWTPPNHYFDQGLKRGLATFLNLKHKHWTDNEQPNLVVADGNLEKSEDQLLLRHLGHSNVLTYAKLTDRIKYENFHGYRPVARVITRTGHNRELLLLWKPQNIPH